MFNNEYGIAARPMIVEKEYESELRFIQNIAENCGFVTSEVSPWRDSEHHLVLSISCTQNQWNLLYDLLNLFIKETLRKEES